MALLAHSDWQAGTRVFWRPIVGHPIRVATPSSSYPTAPSFFRALYQLPPNSLSLRIGINHGCTTARRRDTFSAGILIIQTVFFPKFWNFSPLGKSLCFCNGPDMNAMGTFPGRHHDQLRPFHTEAIEACRHQGGPDALPSILPRDGKRPDPPDVRIVFPFWNVTGSSLPE